jgi:hypothetical protein
MLPARQQPTAYAPLSRAEQAWEGRVPDGTATPDGKSSQKSWDEPMYSRCLESLIETAPDDKALARLKAVSSPGSGAWLNAIPVPSLGLKLDDHQIRISCALRLGATVCEPFTCVCGSEVDASGTHPLSCRKSAGRHPRHSQANDLIKRALATAGVPAALEPAGLTRDDGRRPDGITLFPWKQGKCVVWDFTCWDTLAPSHLATARSGAGKVAELAERGKVRTYEDLATTYIVTPICIETFGAWGPSALSFVKELGSRVSLATGEPRSTAFLMQALDIAVQRGNSACVIGALPDSRKLEEVFDLRV